jgi:hypothetical protein
MKKLRRVWQAMTMLPAVFAPLLAACGGVGSSGAGSGLSTGSFSAYLADSTVANADCVAIDATQNQLLITTSSGSGGQMAFAVSPAPTVNDWVRLECTGGSYRDPATGTAVVLSTNTSLQEAYFKYTGDNPALVVLTPVSSIAALRVYGTSVASDYPVQLRQAAILLGLGDNDISSVQPTDVTTAAADASLAGQYGIALAMLSEMMKDNLCRVAASTECGMQRQRHVHHQWHESVRQHYTARSELWWSDNAV